MKGFRITKEVFQKISLGDIVCICVSTQGEKFHRYQGTVVDIIDDKDNSNITLAFRNQINKYKFCK